ncbi:MAG: SseB family protein [bacterium]|nr:SseB family protein [bacterium]
MGSNLEEHNRSKALTKTWAFKLVMVLVRRTSEVSGSGLSIIDPYADGICDIYLMQSAGKDVLPVFSSRQILSDWITERNLTELDGIPLYTCDVAKLLADNSLIVIDPGTEHGVTLSLLDLKCSSENWYGSETGLYSNLNPPSQLQELEVFIEDTSLVESSELTESEPTQSVSHIAEELVEALNPETTLPKIEVKAEPLVENIPLPRTRKNSRIGIDEINFKKTEDEKIAEKFATSVPRTVVRERQGTFTKIIDVLRNYRK